MKYIKGVTFAPFTRNGLFSSQEAKQSLENLIARTNADFIILVPPALQENAQSETMDYAAEWSVGDDELVSFIEYAHSRGLRVALKPTVNCKNGTWRAHINFFDFDVPCEPKWCNWFRSYTAFQLHYAEIAEKTGCEMFIAGCEMVQTERREEEWRKLIADIRTVYSGLVSYNTDKYQEDHVKWWDAVDVISSSGYYPLGDWENQLDRIEKVVKHFNKPFFFAECGCMSTEGSNAVPNDWNVKGAVDMQGQADWYNEMFSTCAKRDWVEGFALWDWRGFQYTEEESKTDTGYDVYLKPAEKVVSEFYKNHKA